jgi:hypothetical protein
MVPNYDVSFFILLTLTGARKKVVERHSQQVITSRHTAVPTQENVLIHVLTQTVNGHLQVQIA